MVVERVSDGEQGVTRRKEADKPSSFPRLLDEPPALRLTNCRPPRNALFLRFSSPPPEDDGRSPEAAVSLDPLGFFSEPSIVLTVLCRLGRGRGVEEEKLPPLLERCVADDERWMEWSLSVRP